MPVPALVDRKQRDLAARGEALQREFDEWLGLSEMGQPFEKHHSQIRRITARLGGILKTIAVETDKLTGGDVLTTGIQVEQKMLAAHLVWEFFRSRIALRFDERLRMYLRACDEFAWACYEPFLTRFTARATPPPGGGAPIPKEPPLVFLNGGWSPFAVSREFSFKLDRPGFLTDEPAVAWLSTGEFRDAVDKLPFPMIGVPWFQITHLPDALVLAHETAHVVETDFGLTRFLERALQASGVPDDRMIAWQRWRRETFADIFGCLAAGPRFGRALMDFIAADPAKVAAETRTPADWGVYPTRWLRVSLVAETLRTITFEADAETLLRLWHDEFGAPVNNAEFAPDVGRIVSAILKGPYEPVASPAGDGTLDGVISFRKDAKGNPMDISVAKGIRGTGTVSHATAREFVAAARIVFEEAPDEYKAQGYGDLICRYIDQYAPKGTRGTLPKDLHAVTLADAERAAAEGL